MKGDGYCWLYAVMTAFGALENPSTPTPKDFKVVAKFIRILQEFVQDGGCKSFLSSAEKTMFLSLKPPSSRTRVDTANYGGTAFTYRILARFLETQIIVMTDGFFSASKRPLMGRKGKTPLDASSTANPITILHGASSLCERDEDVSLTMVNEAIRTADASQDSFRRSKTREELVVSPPIVVSHNGVHGGGGHFAGFVASHDYLRPRMPAALSEGVEELEAVTKKTNQEEGSSSTDPRKQHGAKRTRGQ